MNESEPHTETKAEIANRWAEGCLSTGHRELIDTYAADEFVGYASGMPEPHRGPDALTQTLATFREGFPDLRSEILTSCVGGDTAAVH